MTTDAEARKLICHKTLAPVPSFGGGAAGPQTVSHHPAACIASDCMAWRTVTVAQHQENACGDKPAGDGWEAQKGSKPTWWFRTIPEKSVGFCGLAGKP